MTKRCYDNSSLHWSDVPGLSQLDVQLTVRQKMPNSQTISLGSAEVVSIRDELICPICLDIMENVMVTKCLHRYCRDCINKHLRQVDVKRDCPSCRINLNTNRSLRKDIAMDAVVNLFFANRTPRSEDDDTRSHGLDRNIIRESARRYREQVISMREKQRMRRDCAKECLETISNVTGCIPVNKLATTKHYSPIMEVESASVRATEIENYIHRSQVYAPQRDNESVRSVDAENKNDEDKEKVREKEKSIDRSKYKLQNDNFDQSVSTENTLSESIQGVEENLQIHQVTIKIEQGINSTKKKMDLGLIPTEVPSTIKEILPRTVIVEKEAIISVGTGAGTRTGIMKVAISNPNLIDERKLKNIETESSKLKEQEGGEKNVKIKDEKIVFKQNVTTEIQEEKQLHFSSSRLMSDNLTTSSSTSTYPSSYCPPALSSSASSSSFSSASSFSTSLSSSSSSSSTHPSASSSCSSSSSSLSTVEIENSTGVSAAAAVVEVDKSNNDDDDNNKNNNNNSYNNDNNTDDNNNNNNNNNNNRNNDRNNNNGNNDYDDSNIDSNDCNNNTTDKNKSNNNHTNSNDDNHEDDTSEVTRISIPSSLSHIISTNVKKDLRDGEEDFEKHQNKQNNSFFCDNTINRDSDEVEMSCNEVEMKCNDVEMKCNEVEMKCNEDNGDDNYYDNYYNNDDNNENNNSDNKDKDDNGADDNLNEKLNENVINSADRTVLQNANGNNLTKKISENYEINCNETDKLEKSIFTMKSAIIENFIILPIGENENDADNDKQEFSFLSEEDNKFSKKKCFQGKNEKNKMENEEKDKKMEKKIGREISEDSCHYDQSTESDSRNKNEINHEKNSNFHRIFISDMKSSKNDKFFDENKNYNNADNRKKNNNSIVQNENKYDNENNSENENEKEKKKKICFSLTRHPSEKLLPNIENKVLKTFYGDDSATVLDVKKFLYSELFSTKRFLSLSTQINATSSSSSSSSVKLNGCNNNNNKNNNNNDNSNNNNINNNNNSMDDSTILNNLTVDSLELLTCIPNENENEKGGKGKGKGRGRRRKEDTIFQLSDMTTTISQISMILSERNIDIVLLYRLNSKELT